MFSATDFLPAYITEFMNFVTTTFPNFGSGRISRLSALWRRDIVLWLVFISGFSSLPSSGRVAAGHRCLLNAKRPYFGRFAPYFERRCLRFFTPCVSSTPRRMW